MRAAHFAGRAKAGFELLSGRWREGEAIENLAAERIEISSSRPRIWVAVDGELRREETPLRFAVERAKIPVLLPRQ
jgi:diacylglycerol kinase family enzyme